MGWNVPDVPGPAALQGCPDTDGDGILNKDDKCPTVKGIEKYNGCPIPDRDGDGVNDVVIKTYLVGKGVEESRITATGHGELEPVADNKTATGRQQNRRSELTLSYYK